MPQQKRKSSGGDGGQGKAKAAKAKKAGQQAADLPALESGEEGMPHVKLFEEWLPLAA